MAIYDLSNQAREEIPLEEAPSTVSAPVSEPSKKGQLFSHLAARFFFLILFVADLFWMVYAIVGFVFVSLGWLCTRGKVPMLRNWWSKKWLAVRRSIVCAIALIVALFSPSFGMMVACTYFLMYDKKGIDEVFPSALQAQFKDLIPKP